MKIKYDHPCKIDIDGMENMEIINGCVHKIGYRTIGEFIKLLKQQNRSLKKLGVRSTFTITLPI
jgi:hypothetical protein